MSDASPPDPRANNFDFLRILAASLVVLSHSFPLAGSKLEPYAWLTGYDTFGALAVHVFFVMSGYLVSKSWLDDPSLLAFVRKRALRILPALVAAVALATLVIGPLVTTLPLRQYFEDPSTRGYLANVLLFPVTYYLPGCFATNPHPGAVNGALWTLPVEVTMYVLTALLGKLRILRSPRVLVALLLGLFVMQWQWCQVRAHGGDIVLTMETRYIFELGIYYFSGALIRAWQPARWSLPACLVLVALLVGTFRTSCGPLASQVALPYLVLAAAHANVPLLRHAARPGDLSYGTYVYAFPIQQTLVHFLPDLAPLLLFVLAFPITLGLAFLSWHLLEKQALRLKAKRGRKEPAS